MITHLTSEQISRIVVGDAVPDEKQHVLECAECSAEAARVRETLSLFRASLERWAESDSRLAWSPSARFRRRPLRWVLAAAVMVVVIVMPIHKNAVERQRLVEAEDALLLEQVNAHVSRIVPAPMEPLMNFISDAPATEGGRR